MKRGAAVLFLALGCAVIAYALQLQMYTSSGPGAGLFPAITGVGLAVTSVLWFFEENSRLKAAGGAPADPAPPPAALIQVGLQLATLAAFVILYPIAGYLVASLILTVGTSWIAGERSWFWIVVIAAVTGPGIKFLFTALGTPI